jgi:hypothetical protein
MGDRLMAESPSSPFCQELRMNTDAIAAYANKQDATRAAICHALQAQINAGLPQASSKLWHAIPVWFIGPNPVVGYTVRKEGVMLMFWNGQSFADPELEHSGSFHVGQIRFDDVSQIDNGKLNGWLAKAATNIWDMTGERHAFIAKRLAEKEQAAVAKKATPKAKARAKAKAKSSRKRVKLPMKTKSKAAPKRKKARARKK